MKKILSILLLTITFLLGTSNVFALDVSQVSLKVEDKSSTITVIDEGRGYLEVNPKLEFNVVGDFITYKLVLKNNDGKKYKVESVTDNNTNEHIKVEYDYNQDMNTDNKTILITFKYDKKIDNSNTQLKSIKVTIKLIDEDDNTQNIGGGSNTDPSGNNTGVQGNTEDLTQIPKTGDNIQTHIWWLFISLIGLVLSIIYLIKNKGKKYSKGLLSILLLLTIIPTIVFASEVKEITFNINFDNVKINAYYTVTFDSDGGSEIKPLKVKHNDTINKPDDPEKPGHDFIRWVDEEGNDYTFGTAVTRDIKLKAKYTLLTATLQSGYSVNQKIIDNFKADPVCIAVPDLLEALKITEEECITDPAYDFLVAYYSIPFADIQIDNNVPKTIDSNKYFEISETSSETPVYLYYDEGNKILKFVTYADKIILDEDSSSMFEYVASKKMSVAKVFDTTGVLYMNNMFSNTKDLVELDLSSFDTSDVEDMSYMFFRSGIKTLDLSTFNTENLIDMTEMFGDATKLEELDLSDFNTSKVENMDYLFAECISLKSIDISSFETSKVKSMNGMFGGLESITELDISNLDTSSVESMFGMFTNLKSLETLDLSNFNTENVTTMQNMFFGSSKLKSINLKSFDTSNVTTMSYMFNECESLESIDLSSFDVRNVESFLGMFYGAKGLKSLNLYNFVLVKDNVDMGGMFGNCTSLESVDLRNIDATKIRSLAHGFENCSSLRYIYVSEKWQRGKRYAYDRTFRKAYNLPNYISDFDTDDLLSVYSDHYSVAHYGTGGLLTYKALD